MSEKVDLAAIYRQVFRPELFQQKGYLKTTPPPKAKPTFTNAQAAKEWGCTPRHASKVRNGRVVCAVEGHKCPKVKA